MSLYDDVEYDFLSLLPFLDGTLLRVRIAQHTHTLYWILLQPFLP